MKNTNQVTERLGIKLFREGLFIVGVGNSGVNSQGENIAMVYLVTYDENIIWFETTTKNADKLLFDQRGRK